MARQGRRERREIGADAGVDRVSENPPDLLRHARARLLMNQASVNRRLPIYLLAENDQLRLTIGAWGGLHAPKELEPVVGYEAPPWGRELEASSLYES